MAEQGFWARRWDHVAREWRVILQAKALFGSAALLLIFGTALVVWRGTSALDNAEIAGLTATIKADEATIKFQESRLAAASSTSKTIETIPAAPKEESVDFSNLNHLSNNDLKKQIYDLTKDLRQCPSPDNAGS